MSRYLALVAICVMLLTGPATLGQGPGGGRAAVVDVATVRLEPLAPTVSIPGTVISRDESRVSAAVSGIVLSVAEVGERVARGEPLAQIDPLDLTLSRRENRSLVAREQSRIAFFEAELARLESLAQTNLAARSQVDRTINDLEVARQDKRVAEARLARIDADLARTNVPAPFDGTVTERLVSPGENVAVGAPVARLVGLARLEVSAMAPIRSVRFIEPGSALRVRGTFGEVEATVRTKVPSAGRGAHMFELRIPVPGDAFAVNEDVRVEVPTDRAEVALIVPRDALVLRRESTVVYRVSDDNVAQLVNVSPGAGRGSDITVFGELVAGDRVVVRGAERLRDGQSVTITTVERREIGGPAGAGTP
jgi:RND family efflux transporter MFP subunit